VTGSYHKYHLQRKQPDLTYILGSRCVDGVVLIADRAFTVDYGAQTVYEDKLFEELPRAVIGFSGDRGIFELFTTGLGEFADNHFKTNEQMTQTQLIMAASEEIDKMNRRFRERESVEALIALGDTNRIAHLKYFYPDGRLESVLQYKAIGHGAPHGSVFMRSWNANFTMNQAAELGYFIIKYIETFKLDDTVGVGTHEPQIWFIPDRSAKTYQLHESGITKRLQESTKARLEKIQRALDDAFTF
jgi:20S proteasome alpha/beta subunit